MCFCSCRSYPFLWISYSVDFGVAAFADQVEDLVPGLQQRPFGQIFVSSGEKTAKKYIGKKYFRIKKYKGNYGENIMRKNIKGKNNKKREII